MAPTRDCHERVRHEYQPNTQTLSWPNADRCGDMRDLVHTNLLLLGWRSGQDSNLYENLSALIAGFKPVKRSYAPLRYKWRTGRRFEPAIGCPIPSFQLGALGL